MRAAVVNELGEVVNVIVADATVDTLPGYTLINCADDVSTRHIWNGTALVPNAELQAEIDNAALTLANLIGAEAWETVP